MPGLPPRGAKLVAWRFPHIAALPGKEGPGEGGMPMQTCGVLRLQEKGPVGGP